jgi:hypothetical protein
MSSGSTVIIAEMGLRSACSIHGGSHGNLTSEYAQITKDNAFYRRGGFRLRIPFPNVDPAAFFTAPPIAGREREMPPGRALFFERKRPSPGNAGRTAPGDREGYMRLMNASGRSSETKLRNILGPRRDNALELGLMLSAALLSGRGAWRCRRRIRRNAFRPLCRRTVPRIQGESRGGLRERLMHRRSLHKAGPDEACIISFFIGLNRRYQRPRASISPGWGGCPRAVRRTW